MRYMQDYVINTPIICNKAGTPMSLYTVRNPPKPKKTAPLPPATDIVSSDGEKNLEFVEQLIAVLSPNLFSIDLPRRNNTTPIPASTLPLKKEKFNCIVDGHKLRTRTYRSIDLTNATIDFSQLRRGAVANIIHSYDADILHEIIRLVGQEIPIITIHDSLGTVPCTRL